MKLSINHHHHHHQQPTISSLLVGLSLVHQIATTVVQNTVTLAQAFDTTATTPTTTQSIQSRLIDKCCQVGKERAIDNPKFNCKLSAREALISGQPARGLLALSADSLLSRDAHFADQCEMILESCCMGHHRAKNCDSGKHFAKSGAACMDVELSKEAIIATESFNDCCMSCSLGILAAKNPGQNETSNSSSNSRSSTQSLASRCKLISPLASSLSGQLYEQTYIECCNENLPRLSNALVETGAPVDCAQSNPCSQRCIPAGSFDSSGGRRVEQDKCDCFSGYKLAPDEVNCVDIDECKLGQHTCNKQSEVCDNTRGGFRCLARHHHQHHQQQHHSGGSHRSLIFGHQDGSLSEELGLSQFMPLRLCPIGSRWNSEEKQCQQIVTDGAANQQRSATLFSSSGLHLLSSSSGG